MANEKTVILVRNRIERQHCWPKAPAEVMYLRYMHRHVFYIDSEIEVFHDDRELEFILVQHDIDVLLHNRPWNDSTSCEQLAKIVAQFILKTYGDRDVSVSVREDNEHGAKYIYNKEKQNEEN